MSYEEMMLAFGEVVGRRPRIIRVPVLSPRLSSYWLGLVTAVPASIARALIGGLKHDIPARRRGAAPAGAAEAADLPRERGRRAARPSGDQQVTARWTEGAFPFRAFRHDYAFYAKKASGSATTRASPAALWKVVTAIGGDNRYYTMNFLWWLRELLDWLVGGPGFTHGRRHPTDLRIGDAIDYWTVIGMERERRLTLNFGMRAPGAGHPGVRDRAAAGRPVTR